MSASATAVVEMIRFIFTRLHLTRTHDNARRYLNSALTLRFRRAPLRRVACKRWFGTLSRGRHSSPVRDDLGREYEHLRIRQIYNHAHPVHVRGTEGLDPRKVLDHSATA